MSRIARFILLAIALLLVLAVGSLYTWVPSYLAVRVEELAAERLGLDLAVERIGGSFFTSLELSGVRTVEPATAGPLRRLDLGQVRVTYFLPALLNGLEPFLAETALTLRGARVVLDLRGPEADDAGAPQAAAPLLLPLVLPRIDLHDSELEVQGEGWRLGLEGVAGRVRPRGTEASAVALQVARLAWQLPVLRDGATALAADLRYTAETLFLDRLALDGREVARDARVGLDGLPRDIPFEGTVLPFGGRLDVAGRLDGDRFAGQLTVAGLPLESALAWLEEAPVEAAGTLAGRASAALDLGDWERLDADLEASLVEGRIGGFPIDALRVRGGAGRRRLRVERAELSAGANRVALEEVHLPLEALVATDQEALVAQARGRFSALLEDLPALLAVAGVEELLDDRPLPEHRLDFAGQVGDGAVHSLAGELRVGVGRVQLEQGHIDLPAPGQDLGTLPLGGQLAVNVPDLAEWSRLLAAPSLAGAVEARAELDGRLADPRGMVHLQGRGLTLRGTALGDLQAQLEADRGAVRVASLTLERGRDRLAAQGLVDLRRDSLVDVQARVQVVDLAAWSPLLPTGLRLGGQPLEMAGAVDLTVQADGALRWPDLVLTLRGESLGLQGVELGSLHLDASARAGTVTVQSLVWENGADGARLEAVLDLGERRLQGAEFDVRAADLGRYAELLPRAGELRGRLRASGDLAGSRTDLQGRVELTLTEGAVYGVEVARAAASLAGTGRVLEIETLEVDTEHGRGDLEGRLEVAADSGDLTLVLEALHLERDGLSFDLVQHATLRRAARTGTLAVAGLALAGAPGTVRLDGTATPGGSVDLVLGLAGVRGDGWLEELSGGRLWLRGLDATLQVRGSQEAPVLSLVGSVAQLGEPGAEARRFRGRFDVGHEAGRLAVRRCQWTLGEEHRVAVTGSVPLGLFEPPLLGPGPLDLALSLVLPDLAPLDFVLPAGLGWSGGVQGDLVAEGTWAAPEAELILEGRGIDLSGYTGVRPPGPLELDLIARYRGTTLQLVRCAGESPAFTLSAAGRWRGMTPLQDLLAGASPAAGELSLNADYRVTDLQWLAAGVDAVRRLGGDLAGTLSVQGPVAAPRFLGEVRLSEGEVRPNFAVPSLRRVDLEAILDVGSVWVPRLSGEMGGAPFSLVGTVTHGGGKSPQLDFRLTGEDLLLFRNDGVKVRADTDVRLSGPVSGMEIRGEVALTDGRFVKNVDFLAALQRSGPPAGGGGFKLFSIPEPPMRDARFDVRVTARNPFRIKNNVARGALRPELKLGGTGEIPVLTGEVYVDRIRVALPAGPMIVESGVIRFLDNDPDRPRLDLLARAKLLGYEVTAVIEGPYDEPVVTLSSVPPVPEDELLLLVLTGQPPRTPLDSRSARGRSLNVAVYLGKGLLAQWFSDESLEADESLLDRFEINIGREVTRSGQETVETDFRLAREVLGDNDTLYLTAERDVFDDFNAGVKVVFRFR